MDEEQATKDVQSTHTRRSRGKTWLFPFRQTLEPEESEAEAEIRDDDEGTSVSSTPVKGIVESIELRIRQNGLAPPLAVRSPEPKFLSYSDTSQSERKSEATDPALVQRIKELEKQSDTNAVKMEKELRIASLREQRLLEELDDVKFKFAARLSTVGALSSSNRDLKMELASMRTAQKEHADQREEINALNARVDELNGVVEKFQSKNMKDQEDICSLQSKLDILTFQLNTANAERKALESKRRKFKGISPIGHSDSTLESQGVIDSLKAEIEALKAELAETDHIKEQLLSEKGANDQLRDDLGVLKKEVDAAEEAKARAVSEAENAERMSLDIKNIQEKLTAANKSNEELTQELETRDSDHVIEIRRYNSQIETLVTELADVAQSRLEMERDIAELREAHHANDLAIETAIREERAKMHVYENDIASKNEEIIVLRDELQKKSNLQDLVESLKTELKEKSTQLESISSANEEAKVELQSRELEISASFTERVSSLEAALVSKDDMITALNTELEQVEELKKCTETLTSEIETLKVELEMKSAELCEIKDSQADYVVLREKLTAAENESQELKEKLAAKDTDYADEVQRYTTQIETLVEELGNTAQSRNALNARASFDEEEKSKLQEQVRSLEADLISKNDDIVKLQIESKKSFELQEEIERLESEVENKSSQLIRANELMPDVEQVTRDLTSANKLVNDLEMELKSKESSHEDEVQRYTAQIEILVGELADVAQAQNVHGAQSFAGEGEKNRLQDRIALLEADIISKEEEMTKLRVNSQLIVGLQTDVASLKSELEEKSERLANALAAQSESERLGQKLLELEESLQTKSDRIVELVKQIQEKDDAEDASTHDITNLRDQLDAMKDVLSERSERIETLENEALNRHGDTTDSSGEMEKMKEKVDALKEVLQERSERIEALEKQLESKESEETMAEVMSKANQKTYAEQLGKMQMDLVQMEEDTKSRVEELKMKLNHAHADFDEQVSKKEEEMKQLQATITMKENTIALLGSEKEQLIASMNSMTFTRKREIEELQADLMDASTKAAQHMREAQSLRLKLEEYHPRSHDSDSMQGEIKRLQRQLRERGGTLLLQLDEREDEINELRSKLAAATSEKIEAEERLKDFMNDKGQVNKSIRVLRERNAALKFEVDKLTKKLKRIKEARRAGSTGGPAAGDGHRFMI